MLKKIVYTLLATILMMAACIMIGYAYLSTPSKTEIREYRQATETTLTDYQIANQIAADSTEPQLSIIEGMAIAVIGCMLFVVGLVLLGLAGYKETAPRPVPSGGLLLINNTNSSNGHQLY